ncbi:MAG: hypothetical protein ABID38_00975 [Candidatus Diapherotrites archaeon]
MKVKSKPVKETIGKIANECREAGATKFEAMKVIKEISGIGGGEKELRKLALEILWELNPEAAKVYSSFERLQVYTSGESKEAFDRGNITKSLLRETSLSRTVAEKISSEVEDKIKDLSIGFITTSLIREMADVKLLEYGHEIAHRQYTRLGLPVHDVKNRIGKLTNEREILREYNFLEVIPEDMRALHFESVIHISNVADFSTRPLAYCIEPENEDGFEEMLIGLNAKINKLEPVLSFAPSIASPNIYLSKFLSGKSRKNKERIVRLFSKLLDSSYSGNSPATINLGLFIPDHLLDFNSSREDAFFFANEFLRANKNPFLQACLSVDSKFKTKLIDGDIKLSGVSLLNAKKDRTRNCNGFVLENASGVLLNCGVNLIKIAENSQDKPEFLQNAAKVIEGIGGLVKIKEENLARRDYLPSAGIEAKELVSFVGFYGMEFALKKFSEKKTSCRELRQKLVDLVHSKNGMHTNMFGDVGGIRRFGKVNGEALKKTGMESERWGCGDCGGCFSLARAGNLKDAGKIIDSGTDLVGID